MGTKKNAVTSPAHAIMLLWHIVVTLVNWYIAYTLRCYIVTHYSSSWLLCVHVNCNLPYMPWRSDYLAPEKRIVLRLFRPVESNMTHAFVLQGRQNLYICGIFEQSTSLLKLPNENLTNAGKKPKKQEHKIFCWTAEVQSGLFF